MIMTASTAGCQEQMATPSLGSKTSTAAAIATGAATTTTAAKSSSQSNPSPTVTFHVVGDAYVDFFSFLDGDWPESGGDSRLGEPVKCYAGGSSVNTATHLKALITNFTAEPNPPVILHTVLNPDDQYGQMLMDHASKHGIPVDNRKREEDAATTGHCIAIVSGGERSFMTHQGVVENFTADDLDVEGIASTPTHLHLHLAGFYNIPGFWNGKLKRKLEEVRETRKKLFPNKNTTISLVTQHDATKEWDGGLSEMFPLLDFVLMNDLEARSIIRSGRRRASEERQGKNGTSFERFEHEHLEWADYFGDLHPTSKTIVTRGEKGSVALRGKKILSKQKPIVMNSIDPTGAGDSFTAGFLFGLWSWKLGGLDKLTTNAGVTTKADNGEERSGNTTNNKQQQETWPIESIEEGMRWGVSLASAAVMIRGASVPPDGKEIQKFLEQANEPEYPVFENKNELSSSCY
eukprot:CAMPEP_0197188098 /NCGR_PEP_ID=MMETSP1423-20130617/17218_1 /TAXON_ID=476441 /ORGANISM="Pseudo-nitzschia heimii, Strain UNC1101" /LENGTH=461 /DNA_ID=CAMNT_0042639855 /DNA_START=490 /DNA_END=1875 /DNA_ORIENTATION=-